MLKVMIELFRSTDPYDYSGVVISSITNRQKNEGLIITVFSLFVDLLSNSLSYDHSRSSHSALTQLYHGLIIRKIVRSQMCWGGNKYSHKLRVRGRCAFEVDHKCINFIHKYGHNSPITVRGGPGPPDCYLLVVTGSNCCFRQEFRLSYE